MGSALLHLQRDKRVLAANSLEEYEIGSQLMLRSVAYFGFFSLLLRSTL
jgi:hypothetical protein